MNFGNFDNQSLDVGYALRRGGKLEWGSFFQPKAISKEGPSSQPQQPLLPEAEVMSMLVLEEIWVAHCSICTTWDKQKPLVKDHMIWWDLINYEKEKKQSRKEGINFA